MFNISYYSTNSTNHSNKTPYGNAAIIIRNIISHQDIVKHQIEKIQAAVNYIQVLSFDIAAIYGPPRHIITIDKYEDFFRQFEGKFIIEVY